MVTVSAILGSIALIVSAFYGVFRWGVSSGTKSLAQKQAEIDQRAQDEEREAEKTGRPA